MTKLIPKKFIFTLMPFNEEFTDIYKFGIKQTCEGLNTYCERVDEQIFEERILDRIYNQINKADIIVADMTGRNPNVYYEVGYGHALGKNIILLTQDADDIPFDLKHHPHIVYNGKINVLKDQLTKKIQFFIENPFEKSEEYNLPVDLYISGKKVVDERTIELSTEFINGYENINIVIQNNSHTFIDSKFQIGIEVSDENNFVSGLGMRTEKNILFLSEEIDYIYPSGIAMVTFKKNIAYREEFANIILKLFTKNEVKNFKISLKFIR